MPSGTYHEELQLPIMRVWDFVSDMNNWAPLVPGYIDHEIINDRESYWEFMGDIGILKRKIKLQVTITKWEKPSKVTFNLEGKNEKFTGSGYFEGIALDEDKTQMTGNLDITATGMKSPVINPVLTTFVPKTAEDLTQAVAEKIRETEKENMG
ncbi:CoxG family protein [Virgibacillus kimchii]